MLTGLEPGEHGVVTTQDRLQPGVATLPQQFRKHGWQTAAIVANSWFTRYKGLDIGFDAFWNITEDRSVLRELSTWDLLRNIVRARSRISGVPLGEHRPHSEPFVADVAKKWYRTRESPLFLMVHTEGVHSPYRCPRKWSRHTHETNRLRADYLNTVEFVVAQFGRFFSGVHDDTILIITADHGEALGEDDVWGHNHTEMKLLREVPLIIKGADPGFSSDEEISHIVVHEWLKNVVAPSITVDEPPDRIRSNLKSLGYIGERHIVDN
jgi:arylsulfatase A-like enzyme